MELIITNNNIENIDKNSCISSNLFTSDRYFTWLNSQLDYRLRYGNKFCYIIISFLMRSNHFRHNTNSIIKRPIWILLIDFICWISLIAFVVCLITGVASPIIDAVNATINIGKAGSTVQTVGEAWQKAFGTGNTIVALVFTVITLIIGIFYLWIITKVIPKNKGLAIKDYVMKKIDYMIKFGFVVKTEQKMNKQLEKAKAKMKLKDAIIDNIIFDKAEVLSDADRWSILQINNIIFRYFLNFNIIIKLQNLDQKYVQELKKIVEIDFKNIKLIENK